MSVKIRGSTLQNVLKIRFVGSFLKFGRKINLNIKKVLQHQNSGIMRPTCYLDDGQRYGMTYVDKCDHNKATTKCEKWMRNGGKCGSFCKTREILRDVSVKAKGAQLNTNLCAWNSFPIWISISFRIHWIYFACWNIKSESKQAIGLHGTKQIAEQY